MTFIHSNCQLLDSFALGVQGILATLAMLSLLIKRYYEVPRRPPIIWFYDVSKQAWGACAIHFLNVGISSFPDSGTSVKNPCVTYLLNLMFDTTLGVFILYIILNSINRLLLSLSPMFVPLVRSGDYGKPPKLYLFLGQFFIFLTSLVFMKLCILSILFVFPQLALLGQLLLKPLDAFHDPRYQVIVVMLIVPLIMNCVQFWITDHIIKSQTCHFQVESQSDESLLIIDQDDSLITHPLLSATLLANTTLEDGINKGDDYY